jgi:hypothetical protein
MSDAKSPKQLPDRIKFHYLKSPQFDTVHADGAIGGLTPRGGFHIAFFAERMPIPTMTEQFVLPDGKLGEETPDSRVVRDGVIRELVVDVMMDFGTAERLNDWLTTQIKTLRAVAAQQNKDGLATDNATGASE